MRSEDPSPLFAGGMGVLIEAARDGLHARLDLPLSHLLDRGVIPEHWRGTLSDAGALRGATTIRGALLGRNGAGEKLQLGPAREAELTGLIRHWVRSQRPDGLDPAVREPDLRPSASRAVVSRWAEAHGVTPSLDEQVGVLGRSGKIPREAVRTLEDAGMTILEAFGSRAGSAEVREAAIAWLREMARDAWTRRQTELVRARPEGLAPVVAGEPGMEELLARLEQLVAAHPVTGATPYDPRRAGLAVKADPPSIRVIPTRGLGCPWSAAVHIDFDPPSLRCDCGAPAGRCAGSRNTLMTVRRMLSDDEAARWFLPLGAALATPAWQRWLAALPIPEATPESENAWLAFRVDPETGDIKSGVAKQDRKGTLTWKSGRGRDLDATPRVGNQDGMLLAATRVPRKHMDVGLRVQVLLGLAGRSMVFWGDEECVLRRTEGRIHWKAEDEGAVGVVAWNGGEMSADKARRLSAPWEDHLFVVPGPRGERTIVTLPADVRAMLAFLSTRGGAAPKEALDGLLHRLATSPSGSLAIDASLLGRSEDGSSEPFVQLQVLPSGELRVAILTKPWTGLAPRSPGEGGPVLLAQDAEGRLAIRRDLTAERRAAEALEVRLLLPEGESVSGGDGFRWTFHEGDAGLTWLAAFRSLDPPVPIEWIGAERRTATAAAARALRLQVHRLATWFGVSGSVHTELGDVRIEDVLDALKVGRKFVHVGGEAWVALEGALLDAIRTVAGLTREEGDERALRPFAQTGLEALAEVGVVLEAGDDFRNEVERVRASATLEVSIPPGLRAELRGYQEEGFRFLARLACWAPGGCLADDMGLGKTVQALALLLHRPGPSLVIAPTSVVWNWMRESERFAPSLCVRLYAGPGRKSQLEGLGADDLLLTSWDLLVRDADLLAAQHFSTLVLDEAQAMKNPTSQRARAARRLDAGFRLALTGTPIENRTSELWSLFSVVVPGLLGGWDEWSRVFGIPAERHRDPVARQAIARLIRPFVLRRLKREVATELPPRTEVRLDIVLRPAERQLYERLRLTAVSALSSSQGRTNQALVAALTALLRLRQVCCDATLFEPDCGIESSKLAALEELVANLVEEGHQVLIFSQFTSLLDRAETRLQRMGVTMARLDGSTPAARRREEVDAFQLGLRRVFLLSLKAGGVGLNLTAASYVIHLDPWWNPAAEDQAIDRAHRIGQDKAVTVYRLVARDTIEERVLALHAEKRELAAAVLDGSGSTAALDADTILELLAEGARTAREGVSLDADEG